MGFVLDIHAILLHFSASARLRKRGDGEKGIIKIYATTNPSGFRLSLKAGTDAVGVCLPFPVGLA